MRTKVLFFFVSLMFMVSSISNWMDEKRFNENLFPYIEGNLNRQIQERIGYNMKIVVDEKTPD